ncbi:DUF1837 domain-containing protein [uncultured Draconibacterium sp.]|uniref:HamA C-terminal domain-containing protein n=1 Tax=uncultured Draconibacterium sp. TaxID=1573823 RepID=UPI0032164533
MTDKLLTHTQHLLNHIYWFKQELYVKPNRDHIGTAINFTDIGSRKDDFLKELVNTIASWVYSKNKSKQIIDKRLSETNNDYANASSFLATQAFRKFRPGNPQGQFGELLLFNFIQYFFESVPLLRKQRITTSIGHERFGADAIHFRQRNGSNFFVLGESKCYESKYKFKEAFKTSLTSIITTFNNLNKELDLYIYDDFIEPELESIAKSYKDGTLPNVTYEMVCLIAYNENKKISGDNEAEIKEAIRNVISERCNTIEDDCYSSIESHILKRINYIVFPIWELDSLLDEFQTLVGSK